MSIPSDLRVKDRPPSQPTTYCACKLRVTPDSFRVRPTPSARFSILLTSQPQRGFTESNRALDAAVATTFFQSGISQTFDDLFQQGAIRLTQVGDDEDMDGILRSLEYVVIHELAGLPIHQLRAQSDLAHAADVSAPEGRRQPLRLTQETSRRVPAHLGTHEAAHPVPIPQPHRPQDPQHAG